MIRDVKRLEHGPFDLLVIGGGIYGAWTAYDAALRGLRVALVEKNDWASGTSSVSSKLIHGGLRYLKQFRIGLVRTSLGERRRLVRLAPHRVVPLRFVVPIYENSAVRPLSMKMGLTLYDLLAGREQPVPPHQSLTRKQLLDLCPFMKSDGLLAGYTYGDCQTDDSRFTLEVVRGAFDAGAVVVNYAEVETLLSKGNRVVGAAVVDRETGEPVEVSASTVVNAAGPWAGELKGASSGKRLLRLVKGVHLVMPPLPTGDAILVMVKRDRRIFFMIPWYGRTLLGTTDSDFSGAPDRVRVDESDIDYLLSEANGIFQEKRWDPSSILGSFAGLRALQFGSGVNPSLLTREWSLKNPREGYLLSIGGKFTSARADAAKLVDEVMKILRKPVHGGSPTETLALPWSPGDNCETWRQRALEEARKLGVDGETAESQLIRFGTSVDRVHSLIRNNPELAKRLVPDLAFSKAEIVQTAQSEMAVRLEDVLRRRLPLLILARLNKGALEEAARLAAPALGWSAERRENEVRETAETWGVTP